MDIFQTSVVWQCQGSQTLLLDIEQQCSLEFLRPLGSLNYAIEHMLLRGSQRDVRIRRQANCGIWEISDGKNFKKEDYQGLYKRDEMQDWPFIQELMLTERKHLFQQVKTPPKKGHICGERGDWISLSKWHICPPYKQYLVAQINRNSYSGEFSNTLHMKNCKRA